MLAYTTIGTTDLDRAVAFYDALLAEIGAKQLFGTERIKFYGTSTDESMLALCIPYDEKPHERGNGQMVAIPGGSKEGVDKLHAKGQPGDRIPNVFYGAYVRDLDGNKLCFMEMNFG